MAKQLRQMAPLDPRELAVVRAMDGFFDPDWYEQRNPDVVAANFDPLQHFIRHGLAEWRDPNRFFDSTWYIEHNSDVAVSGLHPLLHYLQYGATELRNPNIHFDAAWYTGQHPDSAANPLLYHIKIGLALGYPTERPSESSDYLTETPYAPHEQRQRSSYLVMRGDAEIEAVTGLMPRDLITRFDTLGENCEFGFIQRARAPNRSA